MKEGKEASYVWQEIFNLIMIYSNVSVTHLVPWKIQRSCTSTQDYGILQVAPWKLILMSKCTSIFNVKVVKLDLKKVSHGTLY